ncbi:MAG: DUF3108 domain-containing protein [Bacteroidales bacterium]|nr:DUF3108 domain-containing protein [Bacteroidales bacterium]
MRFKTLRTGLLFFLLFTSKSFMASFPVNEKPFISGEELVYITHFGWMNAGFASFLLKDSVIYNKKVYYTRAEAKTTGVADKLFKVRDIYESFFDPETGKPYLAIRNISEGKYRYYNEVTFNHSENKVISQKSGEHDVPDNILDMLSAFYFFRGSMTESVTKVGDEIIIDTYFADEIFPMKMRYVGDEKIKTRMGKFHSMKFSPVVEPGRIFDSEDDVTIWISKDNNHIPLKVKIDLIIGSVKCDLIEYRGLQYPLDKIK